MQSGNTAGQIDNLGIPPLCGLSSYERAATAGLSVDDTVAFIKRVAYIKAYLNRMLAAHLPRTPEWEVKSAYGLHLWLDAEHATLLRLRVAEMRHPPLGLDKVPDPRLEALMDEAIRADTTLEMLSGVYSVIRPEIVRAAQSFLDQSNPLLDYPTRRAVKQILQEEEEMIEWGQQALAAVTITPADQATVAAWTAHIQAYLNASGGLLEDGVLTQPASLPAPRADGTPYEMQAAPKRDDRFIDPFNRAAPIDAVYVDESRPAKERTLALMAKRLREMDVPEWMSPIIYKTEGKEWNYYLELSRQLWDETRHAMMGEVGFVANGVPFYRYPISMGASHVLNQSFSPLEAHVILWAIEQSLMARNTGKGYEWDVAVESGDPFAIALQDYDWADEVLHAQIGRRWLIPDIGPQAKLKEFAGPVMERWRIEAQALANAYTQSDWWPDFIADVAKALESQATEVAAD